MLVKLSLIVRCGVTCGLISNILNIEWNHIKWSNMNGVEDAVNMQLFFDFFVMLFCCVCRKLPNCTHLCPETCHPGHCPSPEKCSKKVIFTFYSCRKSRNIAQTISSFLFHLYFFSFTVWDVGGWSEMFGGKLLSSVYNHGSCVEIM